MCETVQKILPSHSLASQVLDQYVSRDGRSAQKSHVSLILEISTHETSSERFKIVRADLSRRDESRFVQAKSPFFSLGYSWKSDIQLHLKISNIVSLMEKAE